MINNPPYIGANYYPECWDEKLIDWDIARMKELGFNIVRIGEFAWKLDEPKEGKYNFDWLHKIVDKLGSAGIAVIMGTPTAAPPNWLVKKYPDILIEQENGRKPQHGGRRNCCSVNPHYIEYSKRIVEKLGQEFANNPYIIGWQIDNEIYPVGMGCCCDHCIKKFQQHLKNKFKTIDNLNNAWDLTTWSQSYDSFDEISAPRDTWHNPHIRMEWFISQNKNNTEFVHMQADILRKYTKAHIGTDIMPVNGMDYRKLHEKLDVLQCNHYNTPGNLISEAMYMDYYRLYSKTPFWNTETQVSWTGDGAVSQSVNSDGFLYANTWLPFTLGGQAILFWLWRTHWGGQELMHGAVMDAFGRPTYSYEEIKRAVSEIRKAKNFLNNTTVDTNVAMQYTSLNWNMQEGQKILNVLSNHEMTAKYFYNPIIYSGLHPDLIDCYEDLEKYKIIFSPLVYTIEEGDFPKRISEWVKNGGTWVVGPLTDIRTAEGTRYKDKPYGVIEDLTGAKLKYFVPDEVEAIASEWKNTGEVFHGKYSYEVFENDKNADIIARITSGHSSLIGKPCVISYKVGNGRVILVGTFPDTQDMKRIVALACEYSGVKAEKTQGDSILVTKRNGELNGTILLDINGKGGKYFFDGEKTDLLTKQTHKEVIDVAPYQVVILE